MSAASAMCLGCGCTDARACIAPGEQPCHWLRVDYRVGVGICSECPWLLTGWDGAYRRRVERIPARVLAVLREFVAEWGAR